MNDSAICRDKKGLMIRSERRASQKTATGKNRSGHRRHTREQDATDGTKAENFPQEHEQHIFYRFFTDFQCIQSELPPFRMHPRPSGTQTLARVRWVCGAGAGITCQTHNCRRFQMADLR